MLEISNRYMLEIQLWVRIPVMVHIVLIIVIIITPFLNIQMSDGIKKNWKKWQHVAMENTCGFSIRFHP
ncbi:hypothetical protein Hanom_Chr10g00965231 [Helianthus anomalus]